MGAKDKISTSDSVKATLASSTAPRFPCPKCGKETLEHRPAGARICSAAFCRHVVEAPS